MRAVVRVMEPDQFDQWLSQQKAAQSSSGGA